jgi:hypothetical protein
MAVTAFAYNQIALKMGSAVVNFSTDTLKVMLTTSTYVPNVDTHTVKADVTNEISGTGYTAGGATLTGVTWTYDSTNHRSVLFANPTVWTTATFTARYAVVYDSTATGNPLICYVDFGANQSPAAVDFTISWASLATGGVTRVAAG